MLRLQYFPKLPTGQNNKKFILNSILLNFATGDLFLPTRVWKDSCLHYIPFLGQPPTSPPQRGGSAASLPSPLPASTPETHLDSSHLTPGNPGKEREKTDSPIINFPFLSPSSTPRPRPPTPPQHSAHWHREGKPLSLQLIGLGLAVPISCQSALQGGLESSSQSSAFEPEPFCHCLHTHLL